MKTKYLIPALCVLATGCAAAYDVMANGQATNDPIDQTHAIKTKAAQVDPRDSEGKKGLLLYGYDNGASLQFGSPVNGVFKTSLRSIANSLGNKDLKEFSILFTETKTNEQFAIKTFSYENYSYVAINYEGQLGGINYYESPYKVGETCGFSGLANSEDHYTFIEGTGDIDLFFDPNQMLVQTKLRDNAYHDVWDFKKTNNDGRCIPNTLHPFEEYNVSIVFDNVSANGCGNLILYSFAGLNLSNSDLNSDKPIINTHIVGNPVVGEAYTLPLPTVSSPKEGKLSSDDVSIKLFKADGNEIGLVNRTFTPEEKAKYYVYYNYEKDGAKTYTYECLNAVAKSEVNTTFSDVYLPSGEGQGRIITIPSVTMTTNLGVKSEEFDCYVTVELDGTPISGYEKIQTCGEFLFDKQGTYSFVYGSDASTATMTKTVIVDGRLTANGDTEVTYGVGEEFVLPNIEFIKFGRSVQYQTTVYDPFGEEIKKTPFTISQEGIYKVSYLLASEIDPVVKEITVRKLTANRFDDEFAETSNMTTDNSVSGVKLTLKNNKVVTYDKVIDLNKFGFDPTLENPALNQEVLKVYVQPTIQGRADLEALYIQFTDVNDPSNFITVRARYINYFSSGCFVRARSSTQGTYVGYAYNFYTTARSVDNATSHEEGGFVNYLNFTHIENGEKFQDMGLPIYFDNNAGRVYSRPAWLTGHNNVPGEPYDDIKVPWLIYDLKTDDRELCGGNTPWKGFSDGKVKVSFYGKGIGSTANVYITNLGGEALDQKYVIDNEGPEIALDNESFLRNPITGVLEAPQAIVGQNYDVFQYRVTDELSSVKDVKISVEDPLGNVSEIKGTSFVPSLSGKYILRYVASDVFNNEAVKEVEINAGTGNLPISLSLDGTIPAQITYGTTLILPNAVYSGGSGKLNLSVKAVTEAGKEVPIINNQIKATIPGVKYTVTYEVADYLKRTEKLNYEIMVNVTDEIVFDEKSVLLPTAFINKDVYTFNQYVGVTYNNNYEATLVPAKINVTDANGSKDLGGDLKYSPLKSDEVDSSRVLISFQHGGIEKALEYNVPIVKPVTGVDYLSSYFTSKNAIVSPDKSEIAFTSDGNSDMHLEFLRGINAESLLILMGLNPEMLDLSSFTVTLKDVYNVDEVIKLNFVYRFDEASQTNKLYCSLNDKSNYVTYNLGSSQTLSIEYSSVTHVISDVTGADFLRVDRFLDGSEFTGFSSNHVYFELDAEGINNGDFQVKMQKINNQSINAIRDDYEKPVISVDGSIKNRVQRGSEVIVPKATSSDVLNNVATLTVSVTGPNGETIMSSRTPSEDAKFVASSCGSYVVTYVSTDSKGNKAIKEYYISSYDEISPELEFKSNLPESVSVGSTVNLPSYTIKDNDPASCKVGVFVYCPDGTNFAVKGNSFQCTMKGTYVVTYIVNDASENVHYYYFVINAK